MKNTLVTLAMFFAVAAAYTGTEPVSGEINPIVISDQQWEEWMPLFVSWEVFDPENFQAPPNLLVEFLSQSFAGLYANEYNFDIIRLLEEAGHSADVFARYIENIVIQPDNARIYIQAFGALWLEQMINMLLQDLMEVYHLGGMEYLAGFLAFMEVYEPGAELEQPPRPVWEFTPPTREEIETAFMEALDAQGLDLASHLQETRGHDLSYFMEYVAFYVGVSGESFAFHYGTNWLSILVNELVLDMRAFPEVMQLVGLHSSAISVLGVEEAVRFFDSFFAETIVSVQNQGEMIA
ncbi:MAG: hypothetical protein FWB98_09065, partial [Defluviitaleaceae bacterium]|nr:hypothetical protein [Defluviitaleaceae bacterium]